MARIEIPVMLRALAACTVACCTIACATTGAPAAAQPANATPSSATESDTTPGHAPQRFRVLFETSQGPITLTVHRDWAPLGADRFYELTRSGFFDGERFFRVDSGFIAQFGLNGDPAVIAEWKHRTIADDPVRTSNLRGTVAFAMTGPDTRTTQIYINLADNKGLDAQGFAPFAQVTSGMDAVLRLYSGYGEKAGGGVRADKQALIEDGGNAYLMRTFPKLDCITRATILKQ